MNMATKKSVFSELLKEWLAAKGNRKKRGEIVRHVCFVTGTHPKSVPRSFRREQMRDSARPERRGRPTVYGPDVTAALKEVWNAANEPCGENFHAIIGEYVATLKRDGMWKHGRETTGKLLAMSMGTVKARAGNFVRKRRSFGGGKSTTRPSSIMSMVPIRMDGWKDAPAGTSQIDTVAHCGDSTAGDYCFTVNAACVATLWSVRRAQWNKGAKATWDSMEGLERGFPFPVLEWHPDSGSEFINWHCLKKCRGSEIALTRSRPNRKNDNCLVEERNGHVVRTYIGFARFDCPEVVDALNDVYDVLDPYLNHFAASRRIVSKRRVGAKWKVRREQVALTPYQRVMACDDIDRKVKARIREEHERLNPLVLKREIDRRLKRLFDVQKRHGTTLPK